MPLLPTLSFSLDSNNAFSPLLPRIQAVRVHDDRATHPDFTRMRHSTFKSDSSYSHATSSSRGRAGVEGWGRRKWGEIRARIAGITLLAWTLFAIMGTPVSGDGGGGLYRRLLSCVRFRKRLTSLFFSLAAAFVLGEALYFCFYFPSFLTFLIALLATRTVCSRATWMVHLPSFL
ncbi:hypothetical protein B0H13DRAFT_2113795, partial [Mycena leptocephala]